MSKEYFYARISTKEQNLARQFAKAEELGIPSENIFYDKASGKNFDRDDYQRLLCAIHPGDVIYFDALDRMGRNYDEIIHNWKHITRVIGCDIVALDKADLFDSRKFRAMGDHGKLMEDQMLSLMAYMAEQERKNMLRRQREGLDAMRRDENGKRVSSRTGGNFGPAKIVPLNFKDVYARQQAGELTLKEALSEVGVGRTRWYELAREV